MATLWRLLPALMALGIFVASARCAPEAAQRGFGAAARPVVRQSAERMPAQPKVVVATAGLCALASRDVMKALARASDAGLFATLLCLGFVSALSFAMTPRGPLRSDSRHRI